MKVLSSIQASLIPSWRRRLQRLRTGILSWWFRDDLNRLALLFGTDKWGSHWYTPHYQRYFECFRTKRLNLLEIGIGGYADSEQGAGSLRMWKAYLRRAQVVGIDICNKSKFGEKRIDVRQMDQTDSISLVNLSNEYQGFDIIIDDGSHINSHVLTTFQILFPLLRSGGIYIVEDTQTAYWPTWGGGLRSSENSMEFFKGLVDGLNYAEYPIADYHPGYLDRNVVEVAFFHNLVFIRKGSNDEATNVPELIERELNAIRGDDTGRNRV